MKSQDSIAKDSKYGWQKEDTDKSEKYNCPMPDIT